MNRKSIISLVLAAVATFSLMFSSCVSPQGEDSSFSHGSPTANREVPLDSLTLEIQQESNGNNLIAFSTECDPHFFSYNVGRSGVNANGDAWECKAEDWNEVVVKRVEEMNLQRIRVMLLPSWFAAEESYYINKTYTWESTGMNSLYKVLDMAQTLDIDVNITYWGVDTPCKWLINTGISGWCMDPEIGKEQEFCDIFTDCIQYLLEEREYDCIKEITIFNEPTGIFNPYGQVKGNQMYCNICRIMNDTFEQAGIRDKVKFCLSDDTSDSVWLAKTLGTIGDILDTVSSHSYYWGDEYTNAQMLNNGPYAFKNVKTVLNEYPGVPHIWGEVGLNTGLDTHTVTDAASPTRGLTVPRVMLNMLNAGSSGGSYWCLFSEYYSATDSRIMNMGLWAFADEDYVCRPVYYSYSMMTRFGLNGSDIFPIESGNPNIVALALRSPEGKWSYFVVNDGSEDIKVSFLNNTKFPEMMKKYVYDEANVPTNNEVIGSSGTFTAQGRVLTDTIGKRTFVVYAE